MCKLAAIRRAYCPKEGDRGISLNSRNQEIIKQIQAFQTVPASILRYRLIRKIALREIIALKQDHHKSLYLLC